MRSSTSSSTTISTGARPPRPGAAPATPRARLAGRGSTPSASGSEAVELLEDPVAWTADLEQVEQAPHLLAIGPPEEQVLARALERHVADQRAHLQIETNLCLVLGKRSPELRRLLVEVRVQRVDVAVGVDELGRGLLPHPWDAGKIVGGIAAQRRQERVQLRPHSGPLLDPGLVVEHVVGHAAAVVENLHERIVHELVRVPVAGHDHDLVTLGGQPCGERRDHVIGLVALGVDGGHAERLDQPANQLDLLDERLGRRRPARLVARGESVAERRLAPVERDGHPGRRLVLEQLGEHRGEAEDRLCLLARSRRQLRLLQGEPRPEREGVAVEEKVTRHCLHAKASGARP